MPGAGPRDTDVPIAFTEVPADRLPGFDSGRLGVAAPRAALLVRIDTFDADFFGLSPRQAAYMDPRQRMILEEAWHALEDAATAPDSLAGSGTGVFAGSAGADFRLRCDGLGEIDQYTAEGTLDAFLANRISHHFDLRGCSMLVDTASSAGLAAVGQAAFALAAGQVDLALAAGAQVICHGFDQEAYVKAGVLSRSGRVRPFSDESDGFVRGDGAAMLVLKRLADAERDGDPIRAVIRGVAQCHDGRAGGQFSPDAGVQAGLIRRAARRAGVTPAALGYVEAHAAGTRVGDQTEAAGLARVLHGVPAAAGPDGRLWVGAVKAVIGHTEAAAGLFGLIKAILVLENERIPAIPGQARSVPGPGSRIFPLSAATTGSLATLAAEFAAWLESHPQADLDPVAWTLQQGRSALAHRAVLTGTDTVSVARAAAAFGQGSGDLPLPGEAGPLVRATTEAFLAGKDADWAALWEGHDPLSRISLTGYPFERRSHWFRAERPPEPLPPWPGEPAPQPGPPAGPPGAMAGTRGDLGGPGEPGSQAARPAAATVTTPAPAALVAREYPASGIARLLIEQIDHQVRWADSLEYVLALDPAADFVELGGTPTLGGTVRRARQALAKAAPRDRDRPRHEEEVSR